MNKPLYLPIEIKKRELLPKMLLGLTALKKGFSVIIGDKIAVSHAIDFFGPGVYFYKSMNFNDTKHIKRVKRKKIFMLFMMRSQVQHMRQNKFLKTF